MPDSFIATTAFAVETKAADDLRPSYRDRAPAAGRDISQIAPRIACRRWRRSSAKTLLATLAAATLAGCAATGPDGGFTEVGQLVTERTGAQTQWLRSEQDAAAVQARVRTLLAAPLSADDAVQIALLNNRGLQAAYAELGIAGGDLLSAVLPNPRLSYLRAKHDEEYKIETVLSFNVLSLLTVPLALKAQKLRFEQAKIEAAAQALSVAAQTRKAYFRALAAEQTARYAQDVEAAAGAAAELARRMAAAGNFSKLDRMREQVFHAEAAAHVARARAAAMAERERLVRWMGLSDEELRFPLPERLPDIPSAPRELPDLEQTAMQTRLDLRAARRAAEALAESLGVTRATRIVNEFELGIARVREDPEPAKKGYEIGLPIPLFDWGTGRTARAEALYMQAAHRIAQAAINGRSQVREAYHGYRTAYALAKQYRDEVVPLRKQISDEVLLRYNGMLVSVYELLADAREQIAAASAAIEAQRDFWLADAELQSALNGSPSEAAGARTMSLPGLSAPAAGTAGAAGH